MTASRPRDWCRIAVFLAVVPVGVLMTTVATLVTVPVVGGLLAWKTVQLIGVKTTARTV